ncbi:MAG: hypothetical protein J6S52_03810 [Prevotella sp.]|nr:hypothetical protein [Prevotella sp.]
MPSTSSNAFSNSYIDYATLHVPESSISAYKETSPWSGFKDFVALPNFKLTYIVDGEVYRIYKLEEDREIPIEEAPAKEGYTFSHWSELPNVMPAYDIDVTAVYTINKYKLRYYVSI